MSKALDIAENLALLSTKYTSSTSTLDSVALGSSMTGTYNGTLGSSATFPSGHIIQVVSENFEGTDTATGTSEVNTFLTKSIISSKACTIGMLLLEKP